MIHINDLATYVKKIVEHPPDKVNYLYCVDKTKKNTQKRIIESVSKQVGTGKVKQLPLEEAESNLYKDQFLLNINLKPSSYFDKFVKKDQIRYDTQMEEQGDEEEEEEEGIKKEKKIIEPPFKFNWQCRKGFFKNIKSINIEFNKHRGLKPVRIFMTGPPAVGKTHYGRQLAVYYNIPIINVKEVADLTKNLPGEEGEKVREYIEEKKQGIVDEENEKLVE